MTYSPATASSGGAEREDQLMGQSCVGRVAIVTGASRGIGQTIAIRLAAGARVALLGRDESHRNKELSETLEEGIGAIRRLGSSPAIAIRCDIADPASYVA